MGAIKPTIWLTYFAALSRAQELIPMRGDGRALGIMRRPRDFEQNNLDGHVQALMPTLALLEQAKSGRLSFAAYEVALGALWCPTGDVGHLTHGVLTCAVPHRYPGFGDDKAVEWDGDPWLPKGLVRDGDTLVCCCKDASKCHRTPAAHLLAAAGWRVMLDGEELAP